MYAYIYKLIIYTHINNVMNAHTHTVASFITNEVITIHRQTLQTAEKDLDNLEYKLDKVGTPHPHTLYLHCVSSQSSIHEVTDHVLHK